MDHSGTTGKSQCGSSGGRGSLSLPTPSEGTPVATGEEGVESSVDVSGRIRAGQLQRLLLLRKHYREDSEHAERLQKMGCFGWGPGITE